ncbi:hypothetical protein LZD49_12400 [Dyadobacter sp. CY261]|uniref:hypothetical protein n=1 Tax=Dyadobacter sp. CY261 TaxID=2907203 RepID=UPI001F47C06B|nr:hypothetical protein [Dyadobacter sp. CY261]MCF0071273.1 hypothetical protein [Dyadobacter sp. CY261]
MEVLTLNPSNFLNQLILLVIILVALFRLTDGLREFWFERVSLFIIMGGAFFMLASNAHPGSVHFGNDVVHPSAIVASYALFYFHYKSSDPWTSM